MNSDMVLLTYAMMLGGGIAFLRLGMLTKNAVKSTNNDRKTWSTALVPSLATGTGIVLILYPLMILFVHNKDVIFSLTSSAQPAKMASATENNPLSSIAPMVGLLAMLITLITAGVLNLAKKSVDDIKDVRREAQEQMEKDRDKYEKEIQKIKEEITDKQNESSTRIKEDLSKFREEIEKLVGEIQKEKAILTKQAAEHQQESRKNLDIVNKVSQKNQHDFQQHQKLMFSKHSTLELMQQRLSLLHQNTLELEKLEMNDDRPEEWAMRNFLTTQYADPNIQSFMKYLAEIYDPARHGELRNNEKDYVYAIRKHWRSYSEDHSRQQEREQLCEQVLCKLRQPADKQFT